MYSNAPAPAPGTEVNLLQVNLPDAGYESVGFYYLWDPTVW